MNLFGAFAYFVLSVPAPAAGSPASPPGEVGPSPPEPASFTMPAFEVRANPLADLLGPLPLATRRVGPAELRRRPGATLAAVLGPQSGLRLASRGGDTSPSLPSIRGSTAEQVLVLVDGRRRNLAQGGGIDLTSLPLQSIEAVDVVRGGASSVWGSDAIGGAIHVQTRPAAPGAASLRLVSGSFGRRTAEARVAVGLAERWSAAWSGRAHATDGNYPFVDDARGTRHEIENGDDEQWSTHGRLDGRWGGARVRFDLDAATRDRGIPGSEEFPTPSARSEEDEFAAGFRLAAARPGTWRPVLDLAWTQREKAYAEPAAAFGPVREEHRGRQMRGEAQLERHADRQVWRAAVGGHIDHLRSTTDGDRRRAAAFTRAQGTREWALGDARLRGTVAARIDFVEDFAPEASPRLGLNWRRPNGVQFRGSFGTAYRTPSFDELFWPPRASAAGNPDLRPERGIDCDLGIEWANGANEQRLGLEGFVRRVDDLIQWVPGAAGIWRPHNIGRAELRGLEAHAAARIPRTAPGWRWQAALAFLDARDRTGEPNVDGRALPYRPEWSGAVSGFAPLLGGECEVTWTFVSEVYVTRANTKTLPGSARGDVRFRRPWRSDLSLELAWLNVTNEAARDFRNYPRPGRSLLLALTWERQP